MISDEMLAQILREHQEARKTILSTMERFKPLVGTIGAVAIAATILRGIDTVAGESIK